MVTVGGREGIDAELDAPHFYAGDPYPAYRWLRSEAPVFWYEPAQMWNLSKYADIKHVESLPELFSSERGTRISDRTGRRTPNRAPGSRLRFDVDPPDHRAYRDLVSPAFSARSIKPLVRRLVDEAVDRLEPGSSVDFVEALAAPLPIHVIGALLGLPRHDWQRLRMWTDAHTALYDAVPGSPESSRLATMHEEYLRYLGDVVDERARAPRDDLASMVAALKTDDVLMSRSECVQMLSSIIVAGNETTRNALSGGLHAFALHPEQWLQVRTTGQALIRPAVEEILRWTTPVIHFGRTATAPTTVRGQRIEEGDFLVMLFAAANRDEDHWQSPDEFVVSREGPAPHLAFGHGIHHCLGAGLARLELRLTLEVLARRFAAVELDGPVVKAPSTIVNAYETMTVRFGTATS